MDNRYLTIGKFIKKSKMRHFSYDKRRLWYHTYNSSELRVIENRVYKEKNIDSPLYDDIQKNYFPVFDFTHKFEIVDINIDFYNTKNMKSVDICIDMNVAKCNSICFRYDALNNRIASWKEGKEEIKKILREDMNDTIKKEVLQFLEKYFESAIKDALEKGLLYIYLTGWDMDQEYQLPFDWDDIDISKDDSEEEIDRFISYVYEDREKFMMFLYSIYSVSSERIDLKEYNKIVPVLNVYGRDAKTRNEYVNLFSNLVSIVQYPHIMKAYDCISLTRDGFESDRLMLYKDIPVIITKKGSLNVNSLPLKKIRRNLGAQLKFKPVVVSDKKLVSDYIVAIDTSNLSRVKDYEDNVRTFRKMIIAYVEWLRLHPTFSLELYDDVKETIEVIKKKCTTEEEVVLITIFYTTLIRFISFFKEYYNKTEEGRICRRAGLACILDCIIEREDVNYNSKNYAELFRNIFKEKILSEENIKNGMVLFAKDPVDNVECYYYYGKWWIEKIREAGIEYSDNAIKKMAYDAGIIDHFKTGETNVRSTYTIQRKLAGKEKRSYYRTKAKIIQ